MILKPIPGESSSFAFNYINKVNENDLMTALERSCEQTLILFNAMSEDRAAYRYAEGKWSLKEVLGHISDTERIFAYRALRFSRRDATPLSGFDENEYVPHSRAHTRTVKELINEFKITREATICLFSYMNDDMLDFTGAANNSTYTARVIGWMTAGHNLHHLSVIRERY